jgi:hypothetical protein
VFSSSVSFVFPSRDGFTRLLVLRGVPEWEPLLECGHPMQFMKAHYRISMPMSQGSITPMASNATAIQSGGRLPLPAPCKIAMINAINAQANVIGGITSRSLLSLRIVSRVRVSDSGTLFCKFRVRNGVIVMWESASLGKSHMTRSGLLRTWLADYVRIAQ